MNKKNPMIISIHVKHTLTYIQHPYVIKKKKGSTKGKFLNPIKGICEKNL